MTIKQSFKFLYPFCLSLKHKIMLLIRHGYQILGAIIILDAVQVVDYPAFRQWLAVSLFPNKNVFHNIAIFTCTMMLTFEYHNIVMAFDFATFPIRVMFTCFTFISTIPAYLPSEVTKFATIYTRMFALFFPLSLLECLFRGIFCFLSHNIKYTIEAGHLQAEILR